MSKGKIVQIIGPVVDIEFTDKLPAIYNALTIEYDLPFAGKTKLTFEVQQHLGDNWVRAVAMSTTGPITWTILPLFILVIGFGE